MGVRTFSYAAVLLACVAWSTQVARGATFTWIAPGTQVWWAPGREGPAEGPAISGDGKTVVGTRWVSGQYEGFRWQRDSGLLSLGFLPGGTESYATAVSYDGSVVVGRSSGRTDAGLGWTEAFRWTAQGGMAGLGDLPDWDEHSNGLPDSEATGVSGDGSIVVGRGTGTDDFSRACRWTSAEGISPLRGAEFGVAYAISRDGQVIVGKDYSDPTRWNFGGDAYKWTQAGGVQRLEGTFAAPFAVSSDGSVVVGQTWVEAMTQLQPCRWTEHGMQLMPLGAPAANDGALGVSGDGSRMVGWYTKADGHFGAFLWDENKGMRDLYVALREDYGLDVDAASLTEGSSAPPPGSPKTAMSS